MTSEVVRADMVTIVPEALRSSDATSEYVELGQNSVGTRDCDEGVIADGGRERIAPDISSFGRVVTFPGAVAKTAYSGDA